MIVPLLSCWRGSRRSEATATSLGAIVITALAGVTLYALRGEVDVEYALLVGVPGAMRRAGRAPRLQQRLSGRTLLARVRALLVVLGVWLIAG